jgi:hypothetical protein
MNKLARKSMSSTTYVTAHAAIRMAQRGIRRDDLDLITWFGTEIEAGCLFRRKDYETVERAAKHFLQRLRKQVGKRVVIEGARVVTAYHATPAKERRLLRDARG